MLIDRYGDPVDRARTAWHEFKTDKPTNSTYTVSSHLSSGFASSRYDIWRVALVEFKTAPIAGVGVDNFAVDYLRERRTSQEPMHQHSLELRVLAQTGLVGTMLFVGFLIAALLAAARVLSARDTAVAGLAAACLAAFSYWLIHGSVDWFWEVPALGAPAFAWLALAAQVVPGDQVRARPRLPSSRSSRLCSSRGGSRKLGASVGGGERDRRRLPGVGRPIRRRHSAGSISRGDSTR